MLPLAARATHRDVPDERPLDGLRGDRVAYLSESDGPGGAERVLALLAGELRAAGVPVVGFVPAGGEGWLTRELLSAGVPVEHYRFTGPYAAGCARQLTAAFRRLGISLVHSHDFMMGVYGAWAAWRAGARHVITMHGSEYFAGALRRRLAMRAAAGLGGALVAVSRRLADRLAASLWLPPSRVVTIPNGVPAVSPCASTLRAELGLEPEDRLVLAVGNLYPVKGHRHLVDALALLHRRDPRLHLAIAGRGALEKDLHDQARRLGVGERLHLVGLRDDLGNLFGAADAFALPSLAEGLPLALLEAMSAGLPVVASDVGDVRIALAGGEAGRLVPPGDPGALAEALDRLLRRPMAARELGRRALQRAASEYSVERMAARYAGVYRRSLGGERRHAAGPGNPVSTRVATARQVTGAA